MKIVVTELNWPNGIELLQSKGWEVVYDPDLWKNRDRLREELVSADAVIVRNQTMVDAELLGWNHRLKVIGRLGVGLDNIDLQAAAEKNIQVIFGKNANATSVAEYVISGIFAFSRLLIEATESVRSGDWNRKKFSGTEISGKTLGLIGVGEIGHRVAVRAKSLGLKVVGYDPFVAPYDFPVMETGIELVGYEQVIAESDFISLHVPLTPQTRNLMNIDIFRKMKKTSIVINSARGGVVNETDLELALKSGIIAGAVLDVLDQEPPPAGHPLLQRENCIITPHIAGLTEESQIRTAELVSAEVANELEGRISLCRVNVKR
ncbi:hydroxyacid dehydrogenase [Paenibacillus piri]|uniref:Hydroxyacid dehydrogenase n=1 Tax=Paenibacillus piri TaxID=2547395 RepID=A0A4R5KSQ1_9BACL|nr:hydroxyacid dehydrogenase [Paenibacillus piri]TDF98045.1 hydroxyacid dehydrogenase [Paenibacillus piri]